jgi:hypothetical protein
MRIRDGLLATLLAAVVISAGLVAPAAALPPPPSPGVGFTAVTPQRVLDTRNGIGGVQAPFGAGEIRTLDLSTSVPVGATSVVLNLTGTNVTRKTHVTAWPDGTAQPLASNLNLNPGQTTPNLATVALGADRKIDLYNLLGSADLIADLEGYYFGPGLIAGYTPILPYRVLDTRNGVGGAKEPLHAGSIRQLDLSGIVPVGATAVTINLTGTNPTANTYVTAYPDGEAQPLASNLNLTPGQTSPNLVTVAIGGNRILDLFNHMGDVDLVGDLEGFYGPGPISGFTAAQPQRVLDTRDGTGGPQVPFGPGEVRVLDLTDYLPVGVSAVVFNLTGTNATAATFVTAWPDGAPQPVASNLNLIPFQDASNLVVVPVGPDHLVRLYNNAGNVDLVADLAGYFSTLI